MKMKRRRKLQKAAFLAALSLSLLACGGIVPSAGTEGSTSVSLSIQTAAPRQKLGKSTALVPASITEITVSVSGEGLSRRSETLAVIPGEALVWQDEIPNGPNRVFSVKAEGPEALCGGTSEAIDLLGDPVTLDIVIRGCPFTLHLDVQGDGQGTVSSEPAGIACGSDCKGLYLFGQPVTLSAAPAAGSSFVGFSGDPECTGPSPLDLIVEADLQCHAAFKRLPAENRSLSISTQGSGLGRVSSSPEGIDCGVRCTADFAQGSALRLLASPSSDSTFVGFSGDPDCAEADFVIEQNLHCTASFKAGPTSPVLSLILKGKGLGTIRSDPGGIDCGIDCEAHFAQGKKVRLTATAAEGSVFSGFSGGAGCAGASLVIHADLNCTAIFDLSPQPKHPLLSLVLDGAGLGRVSSDPAGIDCGQSCSTVFARGRTVQLAATPEVGSRFAGFSGGCSETPFVLEDDLICTAHFAPIPGENPRLNLLLQGTGLGTVTSAPTGLDCGTICSSEFAQGRALTLTAEPAPGSVFTGFRGNLPCTGASPLSLVIDASLSCFAEFKALAPSPLLKVIPQGTGLGTVTSVPGGIDCGLVCEERFALGKTVGLIATAAPDSVFTGFSGDPGCAEASLVIEADLRCMANFEADETSPLLNLSLQGTGSGVVQSSPGAIDCGANCMAHFAQGRSVRLSASPEDGSLFAGFSGGCSEGPFIVEGDLNCTAIFERVIIAP